MASVSLNRIAIPLVEGKQRVGGEPGSMNFRFWPSEVFNGSRAEGARERFKKHAKKREVLARALGDDAIFHQLAVERKLGTVVLAEDYKPVALIELRDLREFPKHLKHGFLRGAGESKMLA